MNFEKKNLKTNKKPVYLSENDDVGETGSFLRVNKTHICFQNYNRIRQKTKSIITFTQCITFNFEEIIK